MGNRRIAGALLAATVVLGAVAATSASYAAAPGSPGADGPRSGAANPVGLRHRTTKPAVFQVGAAVVPINPTYPVYLGGYGGGPAGGTIQRHVNPLTGRPEDLTVRAVSIRSGNRAVELASVDSQGWFAGYQEGPYGISDVRNAAAAYLREHGIAGATEADVIVSSLHEHAVPTVYGIYGPAPHNLAYLKALAAATTTALREAFDRSVPATITVGSADAPWLAGGDIPEGNEFEGWKRDGSVVALWARDARRGATIATYVSEPAYPNIVYGPEDLAGDTARTLISGDFPGYVEAAVQQQVGGIAVLASGSLGNQASPMQADVATSTDLPKVDGHAQTRAFDDVLQMASAVTGVTFGALAHGHPLTDGTIDGAEEYVVSPVANPAVAGLTYGDEIPGGFGPISAITGISPADRALRPPFALGAALGTWVTAIRIGGLALISEPGEFFGSIRDAWARSIAAPEGVYVVGAAQDFLGYEYPADVTPFTLLGGDELIFGPSPTLGDQVFGGGQRAASTIGFAVKPTSPELSILDQQYGRVLSAGAYLLPSATAGDIDPTTGQFTLTALAAGAPPRVSETCDNPALLFEPTGCPLPDPPIGPFMWSFGDGGRATTPAAAKARAWFSPFVRHAFSRPGTYDVAVTVAAAGSHETVYVPVTVYPALHASIRRVRAGYAAVVGGGDGHVLVARWTLPDGTTTYGPLTSTTERGPLRLIVVDGTGTAATAAVVAG